jgi:glutamine amidotransferase
MTNSGASLVQVMHTLGHSTVDAAMRYQRATATAEREISLRIADRIVLPGDGAFPACRRALGAVDGMIEALEDAVLRRAVPFMGICVGMQLMAARGLEHAVTPGFGWIAGEIAAMAPPAELRLPQMGWNELEFVPGAHPLLEGLVPGDHAYFVHSYALAGGVAGECIATTEYGGPVVAMVARGNRAGTQFHVEKSQEVGLRILANFLRWEPVA